MVTILILYMLMPMTGLWIDDPEKKDKIAFTMIALTCANFAYNIVPVITAMCKHYKLKCTKCMDKRARIAKMKEIEEKAKHAKLIAEAVAVGK